MSNKIVAKQNCTFLYAKYLLNTSRFLLTHVIIKCKLDSSTVTECGYCNTSSAAIEV